MPTPFSGRPYAPPMVEWPLVDPGRLVHRVDIMKPVQGWDGSGPTVVWESFLTTWAALEPVRGTDVVRGGQTTTQLYMTVIIPWQGGIQSNYRVQSESKGLFVIQSVENPLERNVLLFLNCVELGEQGPV